MRKLLWVLVALALVAAACGGGGSDESADEAETGIEAEGSPEVETDSSTEAEAQTDDVDDEIDAAVAALVDVYGDEGAFAVGMFTLEQGYAIQQAVDGAIDGLIQKDGTIEGVEPEGEPLGVVIIDTNSVLFASYSGPSETLPLPIERWRAAAAEHADALGGQVTTAGEDSGAALLWIIWSLIQRNAIEIKSDGGAKYDIGEVLTEILLGIPVGEGSTLGPRSTTGDSQEPSSSDEPATTDDSETAEDGASEQLVFEGVVGADLTYADTDGRDPLWPTRVCETALDAVLTLQPDGIAVLEATWIEWVQAPGLGDGDCKPLPHLSQQEAGSWTSVVEGSWSDGTFSVGIREPVDNEFVPFEGTFAEDEATATVSYTYNPPPSGLPIEAVVAFGLKSAAAGSDL